MVVERMHYRLREDWRFFDPARRAKSLASVLAASSLVLDTRFFDSLTASDSFAPANLWWQQATGMPNYANKNSLVRNSLIVSRSLAAFSNSNRLAASRMSLSSLPI
jgi:hypothetical protein